MPSIIDPDMMAGTTMTEDPIQEEVDMIEEHGHVHDLQHEKLERITVPDHLNTRTTRKKSDKKCSPTVSCTHAGGHCFISGEHCKGTIDAFGCTTGKNCMCCLPDKKDKEKPTCPD